ncbi:protein mono-ADP-ribosyltransferase PARP4-like isoform X2 [Vanacampus margaritifer]
MAVFDQCSVLLDLKTLPFKERRSLKLSVTDNGGSLCFVVTKQCSFVVVSNVSHLSSNRLRSICKFQTPVVGLDYVHSCLQRGILLPVEDYKMDTSSLGVSSHIPPHCSTKQSPFNDEVSEAVIKPCKDEASPPHKVEKTLCRIERDGDLPAYPDDFNVAKYSFFHKCDRDWCVLELQSAKGKKRQQYRVIRNWQPLLPSDMMAFPSTSEEAVEVFQRLTDRLLASGLSQSPNLPSQKQIFGSHPLQQLLLEEKLNAGVLSQDVAVFVEMLWTEALGCLGNILRVPVNKLSLNDVSRAEGLLIQAQRKLKQGEHAAALALLLDVYTLLPHIRPSEDCDAKIISQKLDLCQLIRDILNVSEMTLRSPAPSCIGKFRALRCSIETVEPGFPEYRTVSSLLDNRAVQIHQVLRVSRAVELQTFKGKLGNIKSLLHSSSSSNFVGILSRGLLLPCVGVEHHGIERTDAGSLGSGIYFSDSMSICQKYSRPSVTDGSRLLLVCDVALGRCLELHQSDPTLTRAPEGHNSVHAVHRTATAHSEFEGDEYVVYSPDQVKLKYVVRFSVDGDQVKAFSPPVDISAESCLPPTDKSVLPDDDDDLGSIKNPLDNVTAGLLDNSGQQLPLQAVHVKCKLMDLLSHVIIFQKYTNQSNVPIEAKYVFPLDEYAAVCGFEAFINGKHVVGQVKEKEEARKQYKQAVKKGHGAYLMDQDAPDVFTISVGNLPAGASVLIKVTFVSELIVKDGSVFFALPGSVAPWQERAALNQTTQVTVDKVCVTDDAANTREFSLDMSIEMPCEISSVQCITHKVKMKRTDCKAVVSVLPGQVMAPEGFQLSITLLEVHLPRMWVEEHPDKDSQACMLVFYPNFDIKPTSGSDEVVILLDTSESMRGEPLLSAQRIAQHVIRTLKGDLKINIILFSTDYTQAFLKAQPLDTARPAAESFIQVIHPASHYLNRLSSQGSQQSISPVGGSTELWRPLQALSLLPPSKGIRNLFLLSDGHLQNADVTLQLLRDNVEHSRLFICGISSTANRHMLRALAEAGSGAYEFFDVKNKHKWAEKAECQVRRMASPGCSSVSVKWQQFNPSAPTPVQAPKQLHALFNDCHTLVYGFVPHCTQASLLGNLSGQELRTMVSTSELQKTRGTFLHKLTARALIRDYEDGTLDSNEAEHEGKKSQLKSFIIDLSKEFSILSQFTSFVAIEERKPGQAEDDFTDIPKLLAEEDVDMLPYINWTSSQSDVEKEDIDEISDILGAICGRGLSRSGDYCDMHFSNMSGLNIFEAEDGFTDDEDVDILTDSNLTSPMTDAEEEKQDRDTLCSMPEDEGSSLWSSLTWRVKRHTLSSELWSPRQPLLERGAQLGKTDIKVPHSLDVGRGFSASLPKTLDAPPPPPPPDGHLLFDTHPLRSFSPPLPPPPGSPSFAPPPPASVGRRQSRPLPPLPTPGSVPYGAPPPPIDVNSIFAYGSSPHQRRYKCKMEFDSAKVPRSSPVLWAFSSSRRITPHAAPLVEDRNTSEPPVMFSPLQTCLLKRLHSKPEEAEELVDNDEELALNLSSRQRARPARPPMISMANSASTQMQGTLFGSSTRSLSEAASSDDTYGSPQLPAKLAPVSMGHSIGGTCDLLPTKRVLKFAPFKEGRKKKTSRFQDEPPRHTTTFGGPDLAEKEEETREGQKRFDEAVYYQSMNVDSFDAHDLKWPQIFQMQTSDGSWELSAQLGKCINIDLDIFTMFLECKGIRSLGVKARADILRLLATLLVLQLMRLEKLPEGALLRTLFCLEDAPVRPARWLMVKKAVDWVRRADRQYPCICSRLEFGFTWESATRQLLGYDRLSDFSPLAGLELRRNMCATLAPMVVH